MYVLLCIYIYIYGTVYLGVSKGVVQKSRSRVRFTKCFLELFQPRQGEIIHGGPQRGSARPGPARPAARLGSIPPFYALAMSCDPELAIARAKANQDHDAGHAVSMPGILFWLFNQYRMPGTPEGCLCPVAAG